MKKGFVVILVLVFMLASPFLPSLPYLTFQGAGHGSAAASPLTSPLFSVERVTIEPVDLNPLDPFTVTFSVKNMSPVSARNVRIEINGQGNFEVVGLTNSLFRAGLSGNGTSSISFKLKSARERSDNSVTLSLAYEYDPDELGSNYTGLSSGSQSITVRLPLPETYNLTPPNITVRDVTLNPTTPSLMEQFNVVLTLENHSDLEARNVNIDIDGLSNFDVTDITNRKFLESVGKGSPNVLNFNLKSKENKDDNRIKLSFTYEYSSGTAGKSDVFVNLPFEGPDGGSKPFIRTKSFTIEEADGDKEYTLKLILQNIGGQRARDVVVTIDGGKEIFVLDGSNLNYLPEIKQNEESKIEYLLAINRTSESTNLPLQVKIEYKDAAGNQMTPSSESLGIAASQLGREYAAGAPRVLISKYTLSEEKILAGNVVTLTLSIQNTHARPVNNIKGSLGILMVENSSGSGSSSGGTVFSPVNSSNSFFIQQIPPRTVWEHSINLLVDPNAAARTYVVPVTIEYDDEDAKAYKVEEMVNIPVTQESRLQIISVEIPPMAYIGQPVFVSAEFVNVGKVDLGNFIVMMEGNFPKELSSYFVGNLGIGSSDYYQGIIYPDREGTLEGELVFSYIDNNNREVRVLEPFQIEISSMMDMDMFPGGELDGRYPPGAEPGPGGFKGQVMKWLWLIILVVVAGGVGGFLLHRRAAKKRDAEFSRDNNEF